MRLINLLPLVLSLLPLISSKSYCPPKPACEEEQAKIWNEFVDELYIKKNVSLAFTTHVDPSYSQHNPFAPSGRQIAIDALTAIWPMLNSTIMNNGFSNNTGFLHYRGDGGGPYPEAIMDIFRFDGTCIMEYWDVDQSWPPNFTNPRALF